MSTAETGPAPGRATVYSAICSILHHSQLVHRNINRKVCYMDKKLQNKFHAALYDNLRSIYNVSEKIIISNIILTAYYNAKVFAELLYGTHDLGYWHGRINAYFQEKLQITDNVLPYVNLGENEKNCFKNVVASCRKIFDYNGYYKALYEEDEFAVANYEVCDLFNQMRNKWPNTVSIQKHGKGLF